MCILQTGSAHRRRRKDTLSKTSRIVKEKSIPKLLVPAGHQKAIIRMRIKLEPLPANDDIGVRSIYKKPTTIVLNKLDKQLSNTNSAAWKLLNNIWYEDYYGKIVKRRHIGKLFIEIETSLMPKHYIRILKSHRVRPTGNKPTTSIIEQAIRNYINMLGPDTWMAGDIIWDKNYELIPKITYIKIVKDIVKR